ncbi:MAG TPA: peptide deformylase [Patescibacteria group bacterium]|nr:peptide deformylase [Patescibacteria group bacterium]
MLPLIIAPEPILRTVAQAVALTIPSEVVNLAQGMFAAMAYYHGIGLAASQINQSLRLIVIATPGNPTAYINPEIIKVSWRKIDFEEGCLSLPGVFGLVRRPERILARYYNLAGEMKEVWLTEMIARIYQHEVDHINGMLFVDKAAAITSGRDLFTKYGLG